MRIRSVEISNFLSIEHAKLECDSLTVLVGPNGTGKSNFLRALGVFYSLGTAKALNSEDWFLGVEAKPIEITVEFTSLQLHEAELLKKYVKNESLRVSMIIVSSGSGGKPVMSYHGRYLQHPEVKAFRNGKFENATKKKEAYTKLREKLVDVPTWTSQTAADQALVEWEESHPDECQDMEDNGNFFGFTEVGNGNLKSYTRFLYLPAVKDASQDATEGAGSLLSEIAEIIRVKIKSSPRLMDLEEQFKVQYGGILRTESSTEIQNVNNLLSKEIRRFLPEFGVQVTWGEPEAKAQLSKMTARLIETGMESFPLGLGRQGHGVQRMYILSILKVVNELRKEQILRTVPSEAASATENQPDLIIGIEEPELYQHPMQQRRLYSIFKDMSHSDGGLRSIQILYSTHSPSFIEVEEFDRIRLVRKEDKRTSVGLIRKDKVNTALAKAAGEDPNTYTIPGLDARLYNTMNAIVNEGFFAKRLVLVEGFSDCIFLDWLIEKMKMRNELDHRGMAILPVFGKNNLAKPIVVFREIGIPVYFLFDGDRKKAESKAKKEKDQMIRTNRALLSLGRGDPADFPPTTICSSFTCFENDLEVEIQNRIGKQIWTGCIDQLRESFGLDNDAAKKNPVVMKQLYALAEERRADFSFFEDIVKSILG